MTIGAKVKLVILYASIVLLAVDVGLVIGYMLSEVQP